MKIIVPKAANALLQSASLIEKWRKLSDALGIPVDKKVSLGRQYEKGTLEPYDLFTDILSHWESRIGFVATVEKLCDILREKNLDEGATAECLEKEFKIPSKEQSQELESSHAGAGVNTEENVTVTDSGTTKTGDVKTDITQIPATLDNANIDKRISEVDGKTEIDQDNWAVSVVRIKRQLPFWSFKFWNDTTQHVYLILETIHPDKDVEAETHFMDFVTKSRKDFTKPGDHKSMIRHYSEIGNLRDELFYSPYKPFMKIQEGQGARLFGFTLKIRRNLGIKLVDRVKSDMRTNKTPYSVLGNDSVLAMASASSSSSEVGHNCFTWAMNQLKDLGSSIITGLPVIDDWSTLIVTLPSSYLTEELKQPNTLPNNDLPWIYAVIFLIAVIISYFASFQNIIKS